MSELGREICSQELDQPYGTHVREMVSVKEQRHAFRGQLTFELSIGQNTGA
jgi:hypothetical protein